MEPEAPMAAAPDLGQGAGFLEAEPWAAVEQLAGLAIADIAQEVRLEAAVGEEGLVDDGVVEAAHGADIEPHRAGGDDQIGALQRAVAESGGVRDLLLAGAAEPAHRRRVVREGLGQLLVEA